MLLFCSNFHSNFKKFTNFQHQISNACHSTPLKNLAVLPVRIGLRAKNLATLSWAFSIFLLFVQLMWARTFSRNVKQSSGSCFMFSLFLFRSFLENVTFKSTWTVAIVNIFEASNDFNFILVAEAAFLLPEPTWFKKWTVAKTRHP